MQHTIVFVILAGSLVVSATTVVSRRCAVDQYQCRSGQCIKTSQVCNQERDCTDGEDELNCALRRCPVGEYGCRSGHCIKASQVCNRVRDCADSDDEANCTVRRCLLGEYRCRSGQCIKANQVCNRVRDCADSDDEINCPHRRCAIGQYRCRSGQCIKTSQVCNRVQDCADSDDESNCTRRRCPIGEYRCRSGQCIKATEVCNRVRDCVDGEDEANCARRRCAVGEYRCRSGQCIKASQICDQARDCADSDDEANCAVIKCEIGKVRCRTSGRCIDQRWWCDGTSDCEGDDDESSCEIRGCTGNMFRCVSGRCIPLSWRCDGKPDCPGKEDERDCRIDVLDKYWKQVDISVADIKRSLKNINLQLPRLFPNDTDAMATMKFLGELLKGFKKQLKNQTGTLLNSIKGEEVKKEKPPSTTVEAVKALLLNVQERVKLAAPVIYRPDDAVTSCPAGFTRLKESCYYFSHQKASFPGASCVCKSWGSYLVSIESKHESKSIHAALHATKVFWTGGNDILSENEFIWEETGQPFGYSKWYKHRPNQLYSANCVSMQISSNSSFGWKDQKCASTVNNWLCEKNITQSRVDYSGGKYSANLTLDELSMCLKVIQEIIRLLTPRMPVNASTSCNAGFIRVNDKCYYISHDKLSWYMAKYMCKEWGADLLMIENVQKQNDVEKFLKGRDLDTFWTSGHGLLLQNKFVWDKKRQPFSYTNWSPRKFSSPPLNTKNCVYLTHIWDINRQITKRPWYDGTCNSRHNFICEKKPTV